MTLDINPALAAVPAPHPARGLVACASHLVTALINQLLASQILIALCAAALAFETGCIARVPYEPAGFYTFLFFATLTSYRLHAHVSRALSRSSNRHEACSWAITGIAASAALILATQVNTTTQWLSAVSALLAWFYSVPMRAGARRLREYGLAKILVLAGVWTLMTGVLPLHGKVDASSVALLSLRRFLFVFALCMAFDIRDVNVDARSGIRTLPVRLGIARSYLLTRLSLAVFGLLSLLLPLGQPTLVRSGITAALEISAVLTWLTVEVTRRRQSPLLFLGGIDGMMLLQSLLVCAAYVFTRS